MKKTVLLSLGAVIGLGLAVYGGTDASAASNELYRVYNPNSGEHFYTESASERDGLIASGWTDEGIGWNTPTSGDTVYRVYNSNAGDHHYTKSVDEYNWLAAQGWTKEGTSFYSSTTEDVAIYRAYNPNAVVGSHNFTQSSQEQNWLVNDNGWTNEGIAFYGVTPEDPTSDVDKTALQSAVDLVEVYTRMDFISDADWASFSTALANAQAVLADADADQTAVNAAQQLLVAADTSFKSPIRAAITAALEAELVETDYKDTDWDLYQTALENAQAALTNQINKNQANNIAQKLKDAVAYLADKKVDKTALQALVAEINGFGLQQADFAETGWAEFQTALTNATTYADANNLKVDQNDVTGAEGNLRVAYEALVYIKDVNALKEYVSELATEVTTNPDKLGSAEKVTYFENLAPDLLATDASANTSERNAQIIADWKDVFAGTFGADAPGTAILRTNEDRQAATTFLNGLVGKPELAVAE